MKLYIGNIPMSTQEVELEDLFTQVEKPLSVKIIKDRYSGESRGFGFAEFSGRGPGSEVINQFNGYNLGGRDLKVNEAREREQNSAPRNNW